MQTARSFIGLAGKLATRMKGAQDHLQRGFAGEFGVWIGRDAAPVVADRDGVIGVKLHLDPVGMARHGFIHRVVEHFGHEVMQRAFIRAADIHAGPFAHRLQPFEHLD